MGEEFQMRPSCSQLTTRLCRAFATSTSKASAGSSDRERRIGALQAAYTAAKDAVARLPQLAKADPRAVFANNELHLGQIDVLSFIFHSIQCFDLFLGLRFRL